MGDSKEEVRIEAEQDKDMNIVSKLTNEKKVNLLKIVKCEWKQGQGFMKRMKAARENIRELINEFPKTKR